MGLTTPPPTVYPGQGYAITLNYPTHPLAEIGSGVDPTGRILPQTYSHQFSGTFPDWIIMPAFTLAALPAAYIARITRASTLEVTRQDYVRTAYAKGLTERVILLRHILRNALIPVVTTAGPELAFLISGSFIIENLFSIPGIGRLFVDGVFARDYGLIMGSILFYGFVVATINLVVDVLYAVIDPRIRYE